MKDVREIIEKPREVALYSCLDTGGSYLVLQVSYSAYDEHYAPLPEGERREVPCSGFVRVSEPIQLTFKAITNDEMVARAVESLNEQERKTINELNEKLASIREKRSQLLALTHQPEPCGHPVGRVGVNADGHAECGACGKVITEPSEAVQ